MTSVRTLVVDDHVLLRDGIVGILNKQPDFEVVAEAGSVAEALAAAQTHTPDLILMDYGLPDGTGLDATREILAAFPQTKIVLLTIHEEDDLLFAAVRSGANGYLLKNISAEELLRKLRGLSQGHAAISPDQTSRILSEFARTEPPAPPEPTGVELLTERELEVLQLLVAGASNKEIGLELHISVYTVKNHVHHILEKLNVSSRREAVDLALSRQLINPGKR